MEICYIPATESLYRQARRAYTKKTIGEVVEIINGAMLILRKEINKNGFSMWSISVARFIEKVDKAGKGILSIIQLCGYWAALVFAGVDIIMAFKKKNIAGIIALAVKYAIGVALLYGLPGIFDMFKDIFTDEEVEEVVDKVAKEVTK